MAAESVLVFDACALIAFLQDEPGAGLVEDLLQEPTNRCLLHAVSACEVYYDLCRRGNTEDADTLETLFAEYGLELFDALPSDLWRTAGKLKVYLFTAEGSFQLALCAVGAVGYEESWSRGLWD